jgi:hypothetical protein
MINNKIKTLVVATALLASVGIYADDNKYDDDRYERYKDYKNKSCEYKKKHKDCYGTKNYKHGKMHRSHHKGDSSRFIIGAVYALDLSEKQQQSIDKLVKEFQDNRRKKFEDIFTEKGFDKEAYIKTRLNMRENIVKAKADLIEKIYAELTKKQKVELKKEIDDFKELRSKKTKGACNR